MCPYCYASVKFARFTLGVVVIAVASEQTLETAQ
jgi:hypothetical protein